jgi:hypothetical protein
MTFSVMPSPQSFKDANSSTIDTNRFVDLALHFGDFELVAC